jgi:hypothetical protein
MRAEIEELLSGLSNAIDQQLTAGSSWTDWISSENPFPISYRPS